MKEYYVYILECIDNSYYIGITSDLELRISQHNEGVNKNSYTYNKRPVKLVFSEYFSDPISAIELEKQIKGWTRAKKKALIDKNWDLLKRLSKNHASTVRCFGKLSTGLAQRDIRFDGSKGSPQA